MSSPASFAAGRLQAHGAASCAISSRRRAARPTVGLLPSRRFLVRWPGRPAPELPTACLRGAGHAVRAGPRFRHSPPLRTAEPSWRATQLARPRVRKRRQARSRQSSSPTIYSVSAMSLQPQAPAERAHASLRSRGSSKRIEPLLAYAPRPDPGAQRSCSLDPSDPVPPSPKRMRPPTRRSEDGDNRPGTRPSRALPQPPPLL